MTTGISSPSLIINNENITIVPNTAMYKSGLGDNIVRVGSLGGNSTEVIITQDTTTKKGMFSFEVYSTIDIINKIRTWQDNLNNNTLSYIDSTNSFQITMQQATIITDPEINLQAEATITLEFEGQTTI